MAVVKERSSSPFVADLFRSDELRALVDRAKINEAAVIWDVGMPMIDDRPVLDDSLIRSGVTRKERVEMTASYDQVQGSLMIELSNRHLSRDDTKRSSFGVPIISDAQVGSIFRSGPVDLFEGLRLAISRTGHVRMDGISEGEIDQSLFAADYPVDPDYDRTINFALRMLRVPMIDNVYRAPIDTIVQIPASSGTVT